MAAIQREVDACSVEEAERLGGLTMAAPEMGSALVRDASGRVVGWWVRPAGMGRGSTAVFALQDTGNPVRIGTSRTRGRALDLIAAAQVPA